MTIIDYIHRERQRYLDNCIQCGICAEQCPILALTDLSVTPPRQIQKAVYEFIDRGTASDSAYTKAFACMECFKCTAGMCPRDLNPLLINELIKGEYIATKMAPSALTDNQKPDSTHRILARVQVSEPEFQRLITPSSKKKARLVFFPGCNVYYQPEKILNALDIMDTIGGDYAFLPGVDHCCGDNHFFHGDTRTGSQRADEWVAALGGFDPETVILWCPTCHCRLDTFLSAAVDVPFKVVSFAQYLAEHMGKLTFTSAVSRTVTLHEACKSAYTGVDLNGARDVLRQLPGVIFKEMEHHGRDTRCCGSGAMSLKIP